MTEEQLEAGLAALLADKKKRKQKKRPIKEIDTEDGETEEEEEDDMEIEDDDTHAIHRDIAALKKGPKDDFFQNVHSYGIKSKRTKAREVFLGVPIVGVRGVSKEEWFDDELKRLEIFTLERLNPAGIVKLGRETFNKILSGVSKRAVVGLMVLSYNLMDDNQQYIINEYDPELVDISKRIDLDAVDDSQLGYGNMEISEVPRAKREYRSDEVILYQRAVGYTYLAASYLRLFTKSAENYDKIGKFLKQKFRNFYTFDFPLEDYHPSLEQVRMIKKILENDERYKNTLYVFLHSSAGNPRADNLKTFLFKIHLAYTGLHSYLLFFQCMEKLNLDNVQLANLLYSPMFEGPIEGINTLIKMEMSTEAFPRKMFRYGRLFDQSFMSNIQTKNVVMFALVLAYIVLETTKTLRGGPLKIAHLKNSSLGDKRTAYAIAYRTVILGKRIGLGPEFEGAEMLRG